MADTPQRSDGRSSSPVVWSRISGVLTLASALAAFLPGSLCALSCARGPGLDVFPLPGEVPPNTVFVLQVMDDGGFARGLSAKVIEFRAEAWISKAQILSITEDSASRIEFVSMEPLPEGQFEIWLRGELGTKGEEHWGRLGTWIRKGPPDETYPRILLQENQATVRVSDSSWGGSITAQFTVTSEEESDYWMATVEPSPNFDPAGKPFSILLAAKSLYLSFGPCGGTYNFEPSKQYLVDLTPIDAAGHRGKATAPAILVDLSKMEARPPATDD